MADLKFESCRQCEALTYFKSTFYDDDFVDLMCSINSNRVIKRLSGPEVPELPVPNWCPKLHPTYKEEVEIDEDDW